MNLDMVIRHLERADWATFRSIAVMALNSRGFAELSDGPNDGSNDIRIFTHAGTKVKKIVQTTISKEWEAKIVRDAKRAKEIHKINTFLFMYPRRIGDAEFIKIQDLLLSSGIILEKMDGQAIASWFWAEHKTQTLMDMLGFNQGDGVKIGAANVVESAAYSYALFSDEAGELRTSFIKRAIESLLYDKEKRWTGSTAPGGVLSALRLADNQKELVRGCVDSLLTCGRVIKERDGHLVLSGEVESEMLALRRVRATERNQLTILLASMAAEFGLKKAKGDSLANEMVDKLSSIILCVGYQSGAPGWTRARSDMKREMQRSRVEFEELMRSNGLDTKEAFDGCVLALSKHVMESNYAKNVLAGAVFTSVTSLGMPAIVRAMGAGVQRGILLDASVAIPCFCSLMYRTDDRMWYRAAHHLYEQMQAHGIIMKIPDVFLEECATHLIEASRYASLIETEDDLYASDNSYVAHFSRIGKPRSQAGFIEYIKSLGFEQPNRPISFPARRESIKTYMASAFERFGIQTISMPGRDGPASPSIERSTLYTLRSMREDRAPVLLQHDLCVLDYLQNDGGDPLKPMTIITWDTLFYQMKERNRISCEVWDPASLGDILALVSGGGIEAQLNGVNMGDVFLGETESRLGVKVYDEIIRIEQEEWENADLIVSARRFKSEFLDKHKTTCGKSEIARAWGGYKRRHRIGG